MADTNVAGVETAYSFSGSNAVRWYYQELYNPLLSTPVYSEFAFIPSDNATADVLTATTSIQGKTQLATATPAAVAATGSAGTANATVANADHAHAGVHSIAKSAGDTTQALGDVQLTEGSGITITKSGQAFTIAAAGSSPTDARVNALYDVVVGSAAQVTSGAATHSSIASGLAAMAFGNRMEILQGSFTENVVVSGVNGIEIEGHGFGTVLSGSFTVSGVSGCTFKNFQFTTDISFTSGSQGNRMTEVFGQVSGITNINGFDQGTGNLIDLQTF